ncbi:hypothetical protein B0H13DRAFT_2318856 [Mycena leptocephala]|nr:hypothetical protein B0H13DRAFT_2318856 [Mycena leptocephala]
MTLIGSWIALNVRSKQGFQNSHKAVIAAAHKLAANLKLKKAQEKAVAAEELEEEDSEEVVAEESDDETGGIVMLDPPAQQLKDVTATRINTKKLFKETNGSHMTTEELVL